MNGDTGLLIRGGFPQLRNKIMNVEAQIEQEWGGEDTARELRLAIIAGITKLQAQDQGYLAEGFVREYRDISEHQYESAMNEIIDLEGLLDHIESELV